MQKQAPKSSKEKNTTKTRKCIFFGRKVHFFPSLEQKHAQKVGLENEAFGAIYIYI